MPATPTLGTIRDAVIAAIKEGMSPGMPALVANVVHDYRRFWRDEQKFQTLFKRTDAGSFLGKINGWMLRITSREEESKEWFRFYVIHRFELHGWMGIQDGASVKTEKDFLDQIEAVRDEIRLNTSIFGNTEKTSPVTQVETVEAVEIGDATVWHCLVSLEAERIENLFV